MERICDLHTHSYYSDGTFSPAQLLVAAEKAELSALVLSDHNTVAGLPDFMTAAESSSVEAVPGIEFSTDYQGTELHILGLFLPRESFPAITALMEEGQRRKEESNIALVNALRQAGLGICYEEIKAATVNGFVNRAHIAAALTEKGYTESRKDAFKRYLSPSAGFYVPPQRLTAFDAIRFIKSIGAVAVLAHPFLSLDEEGLRTFLDHAVLCGLDGMEVLYPLFDAYQTACAAAIAKEYNLLPSGGSDFHGDNKPDIQIGTGKGTLSVPLDYLEALRQRAERKLRKNVK